MRMEVVDKRKDWEEAGERWARAGAEMGCFQEQGQEGTRPSDVNTFRGFREVSRDRTKL